MTLESSLKNTSGGQSRPLVVIVGETASGKSGLGMRLAEEFDGEIVAADSRTIYKGMDIGTAKPTREEQARISHHLLDVVEPGQPFSVARFKHLAESAIADIRFRGKLPIMVGGSGLYVDSVVFDYQFRAKYDDKIRASLQAKTRDELVELALEAGFKPHELTPNKRYLIRLIETGSTAPDNRNQPMPNVILIGLKLSRAQLRKRIEQRAEAMFRSGIKHEVKELVERYGWENEATSGIIYRTFKPYLEGKASLSQTKRDFVQNDLKLAKQQRTWFKRNPHINWFEDAGNAFNFVADELKRLQ